jgi:hypothetical protein
VSFKYWVKGGLDVGHSYFGSYLFGKLFSLEKVTDTNLVTEHWQDKVSNDIYPSCWLIFKKYDWKVVLVPTKRRIHS